MTWSKLEVEVSSIGKKLESREVALQVVLNLVPQMICAKDDGCR